MRRPRILDSYCGAGGASWGYHLAGWEVWGVDMFPQHNYPPCQASTALTKGTNAAMGWGQTHFDLIQDTRTVLTDWGKPFVIENVQGAELRKDVTLCGEMFGLEVIRHRHFELEGWSTYRPTHKPHRGRVKGWRHGQYFDGPYFAVYGEGGGKGTVAEWQRAMGIDWTDVRVEIAEAIPPAYTQWLGRKLMEAL